MSDNTKKEKSMIKKIWDKIKNNDEKEIKNELNKLILGELDDLNYGLETNAGLKKEDAETLKELIEMKNGSKKTFWETVKNVAMALGITISAAATIVGIIYTVKGYDFDCKWMEKIFEMKDSLNVIDPNSRTTVSKNRDNHRKMAEHMMNRKFM